MNMINNEGKECVEKIRTQTHDEYKILTKNMNYNE